MNQLMRRVHGRSVDSTRATLLHDERGLSTVEYVIILVLIAASAIALWNVFGGTLRTKINDATKEFDTVEIDKEPK